MAFGLLDLNYSNRRWIDWSDFVGRFDTLLSLWSTSLFSLNHLWLRYDYVADEVDPQLKVNELRYWSKTLAPTGSQNLDSHFL